MRLIDKDSIVLDYSGLAKISPYDFYETTKFFAKQIQAMPTIDPIHAVGACYCGECMFARERYGKLECINGISYRNTYNEPNMFCSYGKPKEDLNEDL